MTASTPKGRARIAAEKIQHRMYEYGFSKASIPMDAIREEVEQHICAAISQAVNEFADEAANEINDATECGELYASKIRKLKAVYGK